MQTALKAAAMVLPGGRIEVKDVELPVGETVDVIVLLRQTSTAPRMTLAEVLAASPGPLAFQSADAVDAYVREERETWDH